MNKDWVRVLAAHLPRPGLLCIGTGAPQEGPLSWGAGRQVLIGSQQRFGCQVSLVLEVRSGNLKADKWAAVMFSSPVQFGAPFSGTWLEAPNPNHLHPCSSS